MKVTSILTLVAIAVTGAFSQDNDNASSNEFNPLYDDFYDPPSDFKSKKAGEILKTRESPLKLNLDNVDKSYQIMYRTTDSLNNATYTITTLVIPKDAQKDRFISYQVAQDSAYAPCAPSFALTHGLRDSAAQDILDRKIVAVIPDYEGPNNAFTAGRIAGHAVLDSIRAIKSFNESGLDKDVKYGLYGYSGGSVGAGWAAQLQPKYAEELDIAGTAVGGFVTNISAVALYVNNQTSSGLLPGGIIGLGTEYPAIDRMLDSGLFPSNDSVFMKAQNQCLTESLLTYSGQDIFAYFKDGEKVLEEPSVQAVMDNITLGESAPMSPLYVFEGMTDEIVPVKIVDDTIDSYCDKDATVQYYKVPDSGHIGTESNGRKFALDWLEERFGDKKVPSGCQTVTTKFNASATSSVSGASSSAAKKTSSGSSSSGSATGSSNAGTNTKIAPLMLGLGVIAALM